MTRPSISTRAIRSPRPIFTWPTACMTRRLIWCASPSRASPGGAAVSGAAAGGVDLDLEGGESRIDFDLLGEPVPEEAAAGLDLDIGSALGAPEAGGEQ